MDHRRLGGTGLSVSALAFGASSLGGVFRPVEEAEGVRAVHAALDAGINYFDVAPAYGATVAESVLGKALRDVPRDRYVLSSKAGKYARPGAYGQDELDYTETRIRAEVLASMRRLGTDYLDIVHLHDFEYQRRAKTEQAFDEGFRTLAAMREEGRIGAVGAGIYPMDLWRRVIDEAPVDAILMHNHYCLNDTRGLELVEPCRKRDIGIINGSPFASGLLTGHDPPWWHPADDRARTVFAEAARFCAEQGSSLPKIAFQFASQDRPFATTLFSTASAASVERNVAWYAEPVDRSLLEVVVDILAPVRDRQWDYDAALERSQRNDA